MSEYVKKPSDNDAEDIMIRYIHFGELNKHSLIQVYLEIASFVTGGLDQIQNDNEEDIESKVLDRDKTEKT